MERVPCSTAVEALDLTMNKGYPTSVQLEIIVHGVMQTQIIAMVKAHARKVGGL